MPRRSPKRRRTGSQRRLSSKAIAKDEGVVRAALVAADERAKFMPAGPPVAEPRVEFEDVPFPGMPLLLPDETSRETSDVPLRWHAPVVQSVPENVPLAAAALKFPTHLPLPAGAACGRYTEHQPPWLRGLPSVPGPVGVMPFIAAPVTGALSVAAAMRQSSAEAGRGSPIRRVATTPGPGLSAEDPLTID
jgi:hypothetical protein